MKTATWAEELAAGVERWRNVPRIVGQTDCGPFCADLVRAMTGVDHLGAFPAYSSEDEAAAIIAGFGGVEAMLSSVLGNSKHPSRANVGDVVALAIGGAPGMGICIGVQTACPGVEGLVFVPTLSGTAAWSI